VSLALGIERLGAIIGAAQSHRAQAAAAVLQERARSQPDSAAAMALESAARRRALLARRVAGLAILRERLRGDGEDLLAQLEHAALGAEWRAARPIVLDYVRADAVVAREVLDELAAIEHDAVHDSVGEGLADSDRRSRDDRDRTT
jgi:hypothetical protein